MCYVGQLYACISAMLARRNTIYILSSTILTYRSVWYAPHVGQLGLDMVRRTTRALAWADTRGPDEEMNSPSPWYPEARRGGVGGVRARGRGYKQSK